MPNSIDERRQGAYRLFVDPEPVDGRTGQLDLRLPSRAPGT